MRNCAIVFVVCVCVCVCVLFCNIKGEYAIEELRIQVNNVKEFKETINVMCLHLKKLKNVQIYVREALDGISANDKFYKQKHKDMFAKFKNENKLNVSIGCLVKFEKLEDLLIICGYFGNKVKIENYVLNNDDFWDHKIHSILETKEMYPVFEWGETNNIVFL